MKLPIVVSTLDDWHVTRLAMETLWIIDGLIGVLSLGFLMSNFSTQFMLWHLRRELKKRELMHRDVTPIR